MFCWTRQENHSLPYADSQNENEACSSCPQLQEASFEISAGEMRCCRLVLTAIRTLSAERTAHAVEGILDGCCPRTYPGE